MIAILFALALLLSLSLAFQAWKRRPRFFRRPVHPPSPEHGYTRQKPAWVKREVIKLKARMPHEGCRTVATTFNSLHKGKGETVGKTYVAETIKRNQLQVRLQRNELKNRVRRQGARNLTWAMDASFVAQDDRSKPVLGILDHGTRGLLALRELRDRTSIGVLRILLDLIEQSGRPRFLRTDNERIFTSRLMRLALLILGIRHQRIDPFCPWQNGRIERLFNTLKGRLGLWWEHAGVPEDVQHDLDTFCAWYNHARPHQSLEGLTPAMAWAGVAISGKRPRFFSAWEGILTGFVASS
jgi:transposase InsO family protein